MAKSETIHHDSQRHQSRSRVRHGFRFGAVLLVLAAWPQTRAWVLWMDTVLYGGCGCGYPRVGHVPILAKASTPPHRPHNRQSFVRRGRRGGISRDLVLVLTILLNIYGRAFHSHEIRSPSWYNRAGNKSAYLIVEVELDYIEHVMVWVGASSNSKLFLWFSSVWTKLSPLPAGACQCCPQAFVPACQDGSC